MHLGQWYSLVSARLLVSRRVQVGSMYPREVRRPRLDVLLRHRNQQMLYSRRWYPSQRSRSYTPAALRCFTESLALDNCCSALGPPKEVNDCELRFTMIRLQATIEECLLQNRVCYNVLRRSEHVRGFACCSLSSSCSAKGWVGERA